ncbi:MAG: hypothetical protein JW891_14755 [Candidatus Lokiarchaeota archaeon]|nr:hypothetical protein [Candidatus Lokiarchaeota archaeon]
MDEKPYIKYKNLHVIPSFHSRIEFAKLVNKAFFQVSPDLIAVELPSNIREEVFESIKRLPFLSLLGYADTLNPTQLSFVPIDPGDSIIEAIKLGLEHDIPLELVDLSVKDYSPIELVLPDDHSLNKIGLNSFYKRVSEVLNREFQEKKQEIRERITSEDVFFDESSGESEDEEEEELEQAYAALEKDVLREQYMARHLLRMMPLYRRILFVVGMGHWENIKYFLEHPEKTDNIEIDLIPHKHVQIYNIKGSDARFLLRELPYDTYRWVKFKQKHFQDIFNRLESPDQLDDFLVSYNKVKHISNIFLKAKRNYEEEFKEFVDLHRLKTLFQYSRNLALTERRLMPNLFNLLISSKNVVDDDFGWRVFEKATKYPYDDDSDTYETMKLSVEGGYDPNGRFVRLKTRYAYHEGKKDEIPLKETPKEEYPGQWREKWEEGKWSAVSYPPEDILVEDCFAFIHNKIKKSLKEHHIHIEEFKSSLLDGIAIKETLRNWGIEKKIYVKREHQLQGNIDTLVIIFDKDDGPIEKYPHTFDWWAEHDKESDMALYTTNPGDYLIGPGISHVEIGGMLSMFPPRNHQNVFDMFSDLYFLDTQNKAERLLKAGIRFSQERYVIYISPEPPRKYFFTMAGIKNRELVYIPLEYFSKESLKRLKHVHILAGRDKRKIAREYIYLSD